MIYIHVQEVLVDTVGMACAYYKLTPPRETLFGMTQVRQMIGDDLVNRATLLDHYGGEPRGAMLERWTQPWAVNLLKTLTYESASAPVLFAFLSPQQGYWMSALQELLASKLGHAVAARLVVTERIENLPVAPGAVFVGASQVMGRSWEQRGGCYVPWESYTRDHPEAHTQWLRVKARVLSVTPTLG